MPTYRSKQAEPPETQLVMPGMLSHHLLTRLEVALALDVSLSVVGNLVNSGHLHEIELNKKTRRIRLADLMRFLEGTQRRDE
jgi:hypothetical protein